MKRNVTLSLCAAMALAWPMTAAAQEGGETTAAAPSQDMSWVPAVAEDGTIRWGAGGEATADAQQQPLVYERRAVPNVFRVDAVELRGAFIVLEDGTRWEVFLPHRHGTVTWRVGDHVLIQPLPVRRGVHTHRLENGERAHIAAVRFAGMGIAELVPAPPLP